MLYYLFRILGLLALLLPPRVGFWLFSRFGDAFYHFDKRGRAAVRDNLRHVLGPDVDDETLEREVYQVFRNQGKNYYDLFRSPRLSAADIERIVTVHGWEYLEEVLARGKGIVLTAPHFGSFDIVMQWTGIRQIPAVLVAEHLQPEKLHQYIVGLRSRFGTRFIPVDGALKAIFRALRAGEMVGLAVDRDVTESGVVVDFFGAPARLPDGYARVACHTGAPILFAAATRRSHESYDVYIEPPIEPEMTGDRNRDVYETMAKVLRLTGSYIRAHPEQWVMFQPIWDKTTEA